jgi:DNA-binding transcriptional MocR family regulator
MQISNRSTGTDASVPLYARLASELRREIELGVLDAGDRLPSVRTLKRRRKVSAATVLQAYVTLEREGWVSSRERSGFFAARPEAQAAPRPVERRELLPPALVGTGAASVEVLRATTGRRLLPLALSGVDPSLLPVSRINRALRSAVAREPMHGARYDWVAGDPELRRQIARHASLPGGNPCDPDEIVVTSGGLEALNLALRAVARPGDVVAVESPTYFGILQALESLGVRAVEVPSDCGTGIRLDLLERALRRHRPKAVVAMTTCHNPHGSVMSDDAKAELVRLTAARGIALIEDDVYGELVHASVRPRTAKSFDAEGLVLLCSSFSKTLAPGLRIGWVDAGRFFARVETVKSFTSLATARLPQLAIAELLATGHFERHLRALRRTIANQIARYSQTVNESFPEGTRMTRPQGGNVLWIQLPGGADGGVVYRRALEQGIAILPGEIFSMRGRHRSFIRISCGTPITPAIARAIGTLGRLASESARSVSRRGSRPAPAARASRARA